MKKLEKKGIRKLFGPGATTTEIVEWIHENVERKTQRTRIKKPRKTKKSKKKKR